MTRICGQCGREFEAKRSTAKFCGSACRARRSKGVASVTEIPTPSATEPDLVRTTRAALESAGRLDTPAGSAAMVAAQRASAPATSDSAIAGLLARHSASLSEALRGAGKASGPQLLRDELEERRRKHGA